MATISLCMIVKNEEKILARCIDSLKGIYDEAIIVDTGSTDRTREIAARYTDKVYDFVWVDDFSRARNYAFSKASCDYVYMADADEVLDEENRQKFLILKQALDGEVEVVQMNYVNQLANGSVYNFDKEPRAKLYKRVRQFEFIDPIHEVIRELPVVYDSDIDIQHLQEGSHADRDLKAFRKAVDRDGRLSDRLIPMYARELVIAGTREDFLLAKDFFLSVLEEKNDVCQEALIVLSRIALLEQDAKALLKYSMKDVLSEGSSETCCILGEFYEEENDPKEAIVWYYNAAFETKPVLDIRCGGEKPLGKLVSLCRTLGMMEEAEKYRAELENRL